MVGGETLGHNFHHQFPSSARFSHRAFDPGFWFATRILGGVPSRSPVDENIVSRQPVA